MVLTCYSESAEKKFVSFRGIIVSRSQKLQKSGVVWKAEPELEKLGMICLCCHFM